MKKNVLLIFCTVFTVYMYAHSGIQFTENATWQQIIDKAKKEQKFILVDCFASWCGPCKWMVKEVFPKQEVGDAINPHYISCAFDMEKGEGIELAKKFNIQNYPTYVFLNPSGEIVHRGLGSMPSEDFIRLCTDALNPDKQYISLLNQYHQGNRDTNFLVKFAYVASDAQDTIVHQVFSDYLKKQKNIFTDKNMKMIIDLTTSVKSPGFTILKSNKSEFVNKLGEARYNNIVEDLVYSEVIATSKRNKLSKTDFIKTVNFYAPEFLEQLTADFNLYASKKNSDWKAYKLYADKYSTTFYAKDWNKLNEIGYTLFEKLKDKSSLQKALKYCLQSVAINDNYYNNSSVAEIYIALKDKIKAKPYALKALEQAKVAGENTEEFEKIVSQTK